MKRELLHLALIAVAITACSKAEDPIKPDGGNGKSDGVVARNIYTYTPNNAPDKFEVVEELTDEFSDGYQSSKWEAIGSGSPAGFPTWDYRAENISACDDCVNLTIKYDPRENRSKGNPNYTYADDIYFSSGMLRSWAYTTYGYYEARIKGAALHPTIKGKSAEQTRNMGSCASFWLYSDVQTGKANIPAASNEHGVYYNEIDIIELNQVPFQPNKLSQNMHLMTWEGGKPYFASADNHNIMGLSQYENSGWDTAEDYHIYACENRPDSIIMYVDNVRMSAKPNYFWHLSDEVGGGMKLTVSLGLRNPFEKYLNGVRSAVEVTEAEAAAAGFPTQSSVDYVRVWRRKGGYDAFPSSKRAWKGKALEK